MSTVRVASIQEVPPGAGKVVQADGKTIALFNLDGAFYALDNRCTHVGGPLSQGRVEGSIVVCPWHGSRFDITTGNVVGPPARRPVATYRITVQGSDVLVDLGSEVG